jgi:hypothetical protein
MAAAELKAFIDKHQLRIESKFVPKSTNPPTLNWEVSLFVNDRLVLTTPYSAGCAHAPSYNNPRYPRIRRDPDYLGNVRRVELECKTGFLHNQFLLPIRSKPILPDPLNVLSSLAMDADVLNYPSFEDWAPSFGYDPDSRKGFQIYQTCLEHALHLRNSFTHEDFNRLIEAAQDY